MTEHPIENIMDAEDFAEEVKAFLETEILNIQASVDRISVARSRLTIIRDYLTNLSNQLAVNGLHSEKESRAATLAEQTAFQLRTQDRCAEISTASLKATIEFTDVLIEQIKALAE